MKTVPLYGKVADGRIAMVDEADHELVMRYRWNVMESPPRPNGRRGYGPYAYTSLRVDGRKISLLMHKLITGYAMTDHINHDGLDNQRSNLREVTHAQNIRNSREHRSGISRFKGVSPSRSGHLAWQAQIKMDYRTRHLGYFDSEDQAARAYDLAARELFGEFACTNQELGLLEDGGVEGNP